MQKNGRLLNDTTAMFLRAGVFAIALAAIGLAPVNAIQKALLPFLLGGGMLYVILSSFSLFVVAQKSSSASTSLRLNPSGYICLVSLDVLLVSALIWAAGPQYGIYALLYYIPILYAGARLDVRACIASSVLAAVLYVFLSLLQEETRQTDLTAVSFFGISALVLAAVLGLLSSELTARKKLAESLGASLERLSALYDVARSAWDARSLEEVLRRSLEEISSLARTEDCFIALLDHEGQLQPTAGKGAGREFSQETAREVVIKKERVSLLRETGAPGEYVLTLPLRTSRGLLGVAQAQAPTGFKTREIETLQALCAEVALAVENASLRTELVRLATTDPLTGLYNRAEVAVRLAAEIARARRYGHPISMLLADIDGLKEVNDSGGHSAGDRVLCRLGEVLRSQVRTTDTAGRWGGDEFCVLLPETSLDSSLLVAERIRKAFRIGAEHRHAHAAGQGAGPCCRLPSLSIGIIANSDGTLDAQQLMTFADRALYAAKRSGKDQVKAFLVGADAGLPPSQGQPPTDVAPTAEGAAGTPAPSISLTTTLPLLA